MGCTQSADGQGPTRKAFRSRQFNVQSAESIRVAVETTTVTPQISSTSVPASTGHPSKFAAADMYAEPAPPSGSTSPLRKMKSAAPALVTSLDTTATEEPEGPVTPVGQLPTFSTTPSRMPARTLSGPDPFSVSKALEDTSSPAATRARRRTIETGHAEETEDDQGRQVVNQYVFLQEVGAGAYGVVHKCQSKLDQSTVAIKTLNKSFLKRKRIGRFGNALEKVEREVAIWKKLAHPHVVQLFEVIDDTDSDTIYLVSEFISGGAVMPDELEVPPLEMSTTRRYFSHLVDAMAFLHFQRIVHRDIKPGNLLVDEEHNLKITDFGVAQMYEGEDDLARNSDGTAAFMAPETTTGQAFSGKLVDVWAAGVTLYMMLYGHVPFRGKTIPETYERIRNDPVQYPDTYFGRLDDAARDLLSRLLVKDPAKRPTFEMIKSHPFCNGLGSTPMTPLPSARIAITEEDIKSAFTHCTHFRAIVRARRISQTMLARARQRLSEEHAADAATSAWFFGNAARQVQQEQAVASFKERLALE